MFLIITSKKRSMMKSHVVHVSQLTRKIAAYLFSLPTHHPFERHCVIYWVSAVWMGVKKGSWLSAQRFFVSFLRHHLVRTQVMSHKLHFQAKNKHFGYLSHLTTTLTNNLRKMCSVGPVHTSGSSKALPE